MAERHDDSSMNGYVGDKSERTTKGGSMPGTARSTTTAGRKGHAVALDRRRSGHSHGKRLLHGTNGAEHRQEGEAVGDASINGFLNQVVFGLWSAERAAAIEQGTAESRPIEQRFPSWKRALDVSFILIALPLWLPAMVLLMSWVKLASAGPIFYRQRRVGYRGEEFMIFKVRTMHMNAETHSHEQHFEQLMRSDRPMKKLDAAGDPRLIRGGRFIRSSGLDELPQLFNVLRGEMTLVGPRPCLPKEFAGYEPEQRKRVNVPPGLTGYWQVNGKNNVTFREMIAMDLFYAKKMSLWLDLAIMLRTLPVLVGETLESRRLARLALEDAPPEFAPAEAPLNETIQ